MTRARPPRSEARELLRRRARGTPVPQALDFASPSSSRARRSIAATVGLAHDGTPLYMSPEHLRGVADRMAAPTYTLGVTLLVLGGDAPLSQRRAPPIIAKVCSRVRRAACSSCARLPAGLTEIIDRAMARDREERIPTARALGLRAGRAELDASQAKARRPRCPTQVAPRRPPPRGRQLPSRGRRDPSTRWPASPRPAGAHRGARPAVRSDAAGSRAPRGGAGSQAPRIPRAESSRGRGDGDVPSAGEQRPSTTSWWSLARWRDARGRGHRRCASSAHRRPTAADGRARRLAPRNRPSRPRWSARRATPISARSPARPRPHPRARPRQAEPRRPRRARRPPPGGADPRRSRWGPAPSGAAPAASPGIATKGEFRP